MKRTNKAPTKQKTKTWHITEFRELFELSDDVRKERSGPLSYTKSMVTLSSHSSEAEIRHFERMRILKAHPDRHILRSVFEDLKNWTASKHYGGRGYLMTSEDKPADSAYLAAQLDHADQQQLKQAMDQLEAIGLLERVWMNGSPDSSGSIRTNPDQSGMKRKALKNGKGKVKNKKKSKAKSKATVGLTASGCKTKKNGNGRAASKPNTETHRTDAQETTTAPTTAPPLPTKPPESDEGGRVIPFARPLGAVEISGAGRAYGQRVYRALGYRAPIDSPEAAREIASFSSKHDRLCRELVNLPPPMLDGILSRGLAEATRIGKRRGNRKKGAVWHTVMDKIAAARISECKVM